jgi:hypothetical protein
MNQSKIANQILNLIDDKKRKIALIKIMLLSAISLIVYMWANQWESPLAVIPRTFFGVLIGYLLLYLQSIRLYPRIKHYFDIEVLRRDAEGGTPPIPSNSEEAQQAAPSNR